MKTELETTTNRLLALCGLYQSHAQMAQRHGQICADDIAKEIGLDPNLAVIRGPLKDVWRWAQKTKTEYNGRPEDLKDGARFRVLFQTPDQFLGVRSILIPGRKTSKIIEDWEKRGIQIVKFTDNYATPKPHGYIGAKLVVEVDLGKGRKSNIEIQFMHENMQETDKITHRMYEEIRRIQDNAIERFLRHESKKGRTHEVPSRTQDRLQFIEDHNLLDEGEKCAIRGYQESTHALYEADANNYGLTELRQDIMHRSQQIHLAR